MSSPIHCLSRAVIVEQNHLLVCYNPQANGSYTYLPGGHIEEKESAEHALLRELKEETNLVFQIERFLGTLEYSFIPNKRLKICHTHEYNFCFLAQCPNLSNLQLPPEPEHDKVRFRWVHISNLTEANLLPSPLITLLPLWLNLSCAPLLFSSQMI